METISNNDSKNHQEKVCKNGCGKYIKWDNCQNAYLEIETNQRHRCPKWEPNQNQLSNSLNHKITLEQQIYADTLGPAILEMRSAILEMRSSVRNIERYLMKRESGAW
jgi:hypothetical protein